MCSEIILYSLFRWPSFCLIFILSKNEGFQSRALLKMPPSSPSMEEFGLDIQNFNGNFKYKQAVSFTGHTL